MVVPRAAKIIDILITIGKRNDSLPNLNTSFAGMTGMFQKCPIVPPLPSSMETDTLNVPVLGVLKLNRDEPPLSMSRPSTNHRNVRESPSESLASTENGTTSFVLVRGFARGENETRPGGRLTLIVVVQNDDKDSSSITVNVIV